MLLFYCGMSKKSFTKNICEESSEATSKQDYVKSLALDETGKFKSVMLLAPKHISYSSYFGKMLSRDLRGNPI